MAEEAEVAATVRVWPDAALWHLKSLDKFLEDARAAAGKGQPRRRLNHHVHRHGRVAVELVDCR
eukprot:1535473-Prymnesium_polylepis.2